MTDDEVLRQAVEACRTAGLLVTAANLSQLRERLHPTTIRPAKATKKREKRTQVMTGQTSIYDHVTSEVVDKMGGEVVR